MSRMVKGFCNGVSDRVADFYDGKSIFMTGASGYLGVVILETLLRCFPGIQTIYILLREKKGVHPECRKEDIFKRTIFGHLKEKNPEVLKKVHVVAGNLTLPGMGMSQHDLLDITREVSIVFHVAACISFAKPLSYILKQNSMPIDGIIDLCKKLKRIDVLVYTSTAYSNSNRKVEIEEQIYRLPFPAQKFLDELKNGTDESVNKLAAQCLPRWPNTYAFSKCLAENVILDKASGIPTVIVRPSIIVSCWKGILPGYIEEGSGMVQLIIAAGKGFVRVMHGDPKIQLDIIPVDIVANTHLVAAWSVAASRASSPLVINCTSSDKCDRSLKKFSDSLFDMLRANPLPKSFQKLEKSIILQKHFPMYAFFSLIEHYVPAFVLDTLLILNRKKPKLVNLYRHFDKIMKSMRHFMFTEYRFHNQNFDSLSKHLTAEEKEVFYTDLNGFSVNSMVKQIPINAPFYKCDIDKKTLGERKRAAEIRYMLTTSVKAILLGTILLVLYLIASQVLLKIT